MIMLFVSLAARENPFFPANSSSGLQYTTNEIEKIPPFRSVSIKLPSSVRILKSVTLTCENLDGSIMTKEIPINKTVDWHNSIVVMQRAKTSQAKKRAQRKRFQKIAALSFISFYASDKTLKIATKDKLLRKFKLVKPDRIVLDFKRESDFRTYSFDGSALFKKITIGNHKGYYRVVIELDGRYAFSVHPYKNGYILKVK